MSSPLITLLAVNDEYEFYRVRSFSDGSKEYGVDIDKNEMTCFCTCPDFLFRKQTEKWGGARIDDPVHHCKHIREVLDGNYEEESYNHS